MNGTKRAAQVADGDRLIQQIEAAFADAGEPVRFILVPLDGEISTTAGGPWRGRLETADEISIPFALLPPMHAHGWRIETVGYRKEGFRPDFFDAVGLLRAVLRAVGNERPLRAAKRVADRVAAPYKPVGPVMVSVAGFGNGALRVDFSATASEAQIAAVLDAAVAVGLLTKA